MTNLQITLTVLYFVANAFYAGMHYENNSTFDRTTGEKIFTILSSISLTLFAIPVVIFLILYALGELFFEYLDKQFQLKFWITYPFTKRWNDMDVHRLEQINKAYNKKKNNKKWYQFKDRIYCCCVEIINKKNDNYVYTPPKEEE